MQLVFSDVLKNKQHIWDTIDIYFSAMQHQNVGKAGTQFHERAAELNNVVLANQKYQSTRFVRALMRGLTAGLRNLPTLVSVLYSEFYDAAVNFKNTRGKELDRIISNLRNANNLFFTIGLMQILEHYCKASLEVPHASHFPIQVS